MGEEQAAESQQSPMNVKRIYEQPADAISLYSDFVQILGTAHEVVLQFYETIPGTPGGPAGTPEFVTTRLRATIAVSEALAVNIGNLLIERSGPQEQEKEQES